MPKPYWFGARMTWSSTSNQAGVQNSSVPLCRRAVPLGGLTGSLCAFSDKLETPSPLVWLWPSEATVQSPGTGIFRVPVFVACHLQGPGSWCCVALPGLIPGKRVMGARHQIPEQLTWRWRDRSPHQDPASDNLCVVGVGSALLRSHCHRCTHPQL